MNFEIISWVVVDAVKELHAKSSHILMDYMKALSEEKSYKKGCIGYGIERKT